ncbi:MAG: orotidine-5'-phosphate decarboxylase [Elusimicrobia bacterium]|nr:orotidine-5'-phosphate decarboxylase [Elusimicrobiota bacterium]
MKKLIVALDVKDGPVALSLVKTLSPWVDIFKVGPILFLSEGPALIRAIHALEKKVFLDLKFHDIPATVRRSVESAQQLGVYSLTIHSCGGAEMMKAAAQVSPRPKIWAVTVLTSQVTTPEEVIARARSAADSGVDGVIASPLEISAIKKACGTGFTVTTPGIRVVETADDQKRTATPKEAVAAGADFIVVGRPIIEAKDPAAAAQSIAEQIERI